MIGDSGTFCVGALVTYSSFRSMAGIGGGGEESERDF